MSSARLDDFEGLRDCFAELEGRRFLGVVDGGDGVELVFEDAGPDACNLVTVHHAGPYVGIVAFGGVCEPEGYVDPTCDWFALLMERDR